ncbi:hypothetical protein GW17_00048579 [Ensete ventricosum]|nr:hypothetical protein GW17_00048579 [Ensete ventricosum]
MIASIDEGCGYRQRKGECIDHRRKRMSDRRRSRRGPAIAVSVEDVGARQGGGSQLPQLLLLCGLQHFYGKRSREAGAEKRCRLEGRESNPRQRRQIGVVEGVQGATAREVLARKRSTRQGAGIAAWGHDRGGGRDFFFSLPREEDEESAHRRKILSLDSIGMGNCGRCYGKMGRQQDEALSTTVEEDVGEETTAAIGATTRWVRLEAAGGDEVAIGDDDAVATEAVVVLKMSWLEIWRHYWPSIVRNTSLSPRTGFHKCTVGEDGLLGHWTSNGYH